MAAHAPYANYCAINNGVLLGVRGDGMRFQLAPGGDVGYAKASPEGADGA